MRNFSLVVCFLFVASAAAPAQQKYFQNWPDNADPHIIGDRIAMHFLESGHMDPIGYPRCARGTAR